MTVRTFAYRVLPLAIALALLVAIAGACVFGCYDPNNPPPCRPGSVDYPRCDPTQPVLFTPDWTVDVDGGNPG